VQDLLKNVRIGVNPKIYLKDPESSDLGRSILYNGLPLINELGMEGFTFKKLACEIGSTESAIYRYFENKHKLLLYYVSWYWGWLEYKLVFGTANIQSPTRKLEMAIRILTLNIDHNEAAPFRLDSLEQVIISESSKAYCTKEVDHENKDGIFAQFKSLAQRLQTIIEEVSPGCPYSKSLSSLLIESHLEQLFFVEHLPSLSDLDRDDKGRFAFYKHLIFSSIAKWQK
jgi:AcrR family transcriptional regulator